MKSEREALDLMGRYLDGQSTAEEAARLESLMMADAQLRTEFLACARVEASLRTGISGKTVIDALPMNRTVRQPRWNVLWAPLAAAALVIAAFVWHLGFGGRPEVVARFDALDFCRWMDPSAQVNAGDPIALGERIGLSAGRAVIHYDTGARVTVIGPASFEVRSRNGGFLMLGKADFIAETAESKGFVLETPTSKFVDIGTAFSAGVAADGLCRLEVSEGIVDVILADPDAKRRLQAGDTMWVEPGEKKILTRIEAGDGTPAFRFPTLPPPGSDDYADQSQGHASIRVTHGTLGRDSGRLGGRADVLLDGIGQSKQDSPRESAYFHPENKGGFLIDLGQEVAIRGIHTYSWHQHEVIAEHRERAQQRFTLYGFAGDEPPDLTQPLDETGWTRIARVNTDESLHVKSRLDRPAQQACAISAEHGDIGRYRYLLLDLKGGTFYGEIDVQAEP